MRCPDCGQEMSCRLEELPYTQCGLDNVYLAEAERFICACGQGAVGVYAAPQVNAIIGERLARKPALLTGTEICFLRKNMGLASKELAELLGVDKATVSRWENNSQAPTPTADRLIRLIYAAKKGISAQSLMEGFGSIEEKREPAGRFVVPRAWWKGEGDGEACGRWK